MRHDNTGKNASGRGNPWGRESGIFGSAESSTTKAIEVNLFLESHSVNGSRAVAAIERASVFLR
jgi:hypothetical protein